MKRGFFLVLIVLIAICESGRERTLPPDARPEKILEFAQDKIKELKLEDILDQSHTVVVCIYEKFETKGGYDTLGILNFQITLTPIIYLKGDLKTENIYLQVHSPGLSGFGHQKNYQKRFLIFLDIDKYSDKQYGGGIDFIKAIILDKWEKTEEIFDFNN